MCYGQVIREWRNGYSDMLLAKVSCSLDKIDCTMTQYAKEEYLDNGFLKWFMIHCRILVVEDINYTKGGGAGNIPGYRNKVGVLGGLHILKQPIHSRIHLHIDGMIGTYGAANLDKNGLYQIFMKDLHLFLLALYNVTTWKRRQRDWWWSLTVAAVLMQ